VKTVVDIINLLLSILLKGGIPEEVWSRKKALYNHLKVFDCRAFVHIPTDERAKLYSRQRNTFISNLQVMNLATDYGIR